MVNSGLKPKNVLRELVKNWDRFQETKIRVFSSDGQFEMRPLSAVANNEPPIKE
jgi:hypothetical protein